MRLIRPVDGILSIKVGRKIVLVLDLLQRRMNKNRNRFASTLRLGYIAGCTLGIVKPRRSMKYRRSCCFVMFQAQLFMMHQVELKVISNVQRIRYTKSLALLLLCTSITYANPRVHFAHFVQVHMKALTVLSARTSFLSLK